MNNNVLLFFKIINKPLWLIKHKAHEEQIESIFVQPQPQPQQDLQMKRVETPDVYIQEDDLLQETISPPSALQFLQNKDTLIVISLQLYENFSDISDEIKFLQNIVIKGLKESELINVYDKAVVIDFDASLSERFEFFKQIISKNANNKQYIWLVGKNIAQVLAIKNAENYTVAHALQKEVLILPDMTDLLKISHKQEEKKQLWHFLQKVYKITKSSTK